MVNEELKKELIDAIMELSREERAKLLDILKSAGIIRNGGNSGE